MFNMTKYTSNFKAPPFTYTPSTQVFSFCLIRPTFGLCEPVFD